MFVDQNEEYTITARDASGKTVGAKLPGVLGSERENNRKNNPVNKTIRSSIEKLNAGPVNISLRFIGQTGYLRIRGFEGEQFTVESDSIFLQLRNKKTKALILDLRGNGGGVFTDATYKMLNEGVIRDPQGGFLVSEKLHEGVGMQSPGKNPFTGKTFVLTDGISFSTAADVAAVLHNAKKAIFIGEETGRAYEGNTSGLNAQVNSKNSGFRVRIHMYEYWNAVLATKKGRGTLPDHVV